MAKAVQQEAETPKAAPKAAPLPAAVLPGLLLQVFAQLMELE
jgi:hypothetical protein